MFFDTSKHNEFIPQLFDSRSLAKENIFKNIWIQPAAGDAGGSLGAALALWHIDQGNKRIINSMFLANQLLRRFHKHAALLQPTAPEKALKYLMPLLPLDPWAQSLSM